MTCTDLGVLLAARAAGDLAPEEAALLDAHLPGCTRCRAELATCEEVLTLARVTKAAPVLGDLAPATLARWKVHRRPRVMIFALGGGLAAVAAVALLVVASGVSFHRADRSPGPATLAAWDTDVDSIDEAEAELDLYVGSEIDGAEDTTSAVVLAAEDTNLAEASLAELDLADGDFTDDDL